MAKPVAAAIALLILPAAAGAQPSALTGVTVSPPVKCLQPHSPADPSIPAPRVISSFPASGAVVRPGKLIVRITVDLPMSCGGSFLDAAPLRAPFVAGDRLVKLTPDLKTFRVEGYVSRNRSYGLSMNPAPVRDFVGLSGQALEPFRLTFRTSAGPAVTTVKEALAEDVEAGR